MIVVAGVSIDVIVADALTTEVDVLALKHAQALYGVDKHASKFLDPAAVAALPRPGDHQVFTELRGSRGPRALLFVGVPRLRDFLYDDIREWSRKVLISLTTALPDIRTLAITLHGPGFGLDELACFEAEMSGIVSSLTAREHPPGLVEILVLETDARRAARLAEYLEQVGRATSSAPDAAQQPIEHRRQTAFVAMPFDEHFEDVYTFGIQQVLHVLGIKSERVDQTTFVGDIVTEIRRRIARSDLVVADLTGANPNVYLEVGFAWASDRVTILVADKSVDSALKFDTQGQRCLFYDSIRDLGNRLRAEVEGLRSSGDLPPAMS